MFLNLGLLGLNSISFLFVPVVGKENIPESLDKFQHYDSYVSKLVENPKNLHLEEPKAENDQDIILKLKILSDKQYDYDENIYIAEGNIKALINDGILRADFLRYEKRTGILSAEGNVRFKKGKQYFRGKEFKFNLLKKQGFIKDSYGLLDINNVLDDLKLDSYSKKILLKNQSLDALTNKDKNTYKDGIEFFYGNIKLPQNKITRANKSIGSINNWRFKSDLININEKGWRANKISFTNDPFDPHQISFEAIDVIAEEVDDGRLLITSSKTNLIFGSRTKFPLGKRIFGEKKKEGKFELIYDSKDKDGLVIARRSDTKKINNNIKVDFKPQLLINRALLGKTNSYNNDESKGSKNISFSDIFGLNIKLDANYKDWEFDSINDFSTLNKARIFSGLRHSSSFRKYVKMPIFDYSSFNIFTTYRSRAWNGTIGETEIKSAYGGFVEKNDSFQSGVVKSDLKLRFGRAKYEAEKLRSRKIINLWRSSIFASFDSEYEIWKMNRKDISQNKEFVLSPVLINPELIFRTNINSAYFKYEDGKDQAFLKLSLGPEIRLGKLERNFLDYTKLSVMPGFKIKAGNSPFKFDNAIDLRTLNIIFTQQIYGPLMVDINSNLNIDNRSENYGDYYDTKLGVLWHKRAYEFGIYYHPDNEAGGLYFRINGFNFDDSVKAVF